MRVNIHGAKAIAKILSVDKDLKHLHLFDAGLDCEAMLGLCEGFK